MREHAHVHTIAIGGLPRPGPMQSVGGSKGSQVYKADTIMGFANLTLHELLDPYGDEQLRARVNETIVGTLANPGQLILRSDYITDPDRYIFAAVNSQNQLRPNDKTETPLEFVYEAADCRIFYTADYLFDQTFVWKQVVDTKWGEGKCAEGSTGHKSSVSVINNQPFKVKQSQASQNSPKPSTGPSQTQQFQGAASGLRMSGSLIMVAGAMVASVMFLL